MKRIIFFLILTLMPGFVPGSSAEDAQRIPKNLVIAGEVIDGYRIFSISAADTDLQLKAFRGDYIKFQLDASFQNPVLSIPALSIHQTLTNDLRKAPYFKMKTAGTYAFTLEQIRGDIIVEDYRQASYREVTSREAAEFIKSDHPLILDVRTPGEYQSGHLKDAILIPVQQLQSRLKELSAFKDKDILIYCATGNRSTVASKILIDNGFKGITNLRRGIVDWQTHKYPVIR